MDDVLRGQDGKIIGRSSGVIGSIGANEFNVEAAKDGNDIYLTIDQNIQKYIENILPYYHEWFIADAISVVVMNPHTGAVRATANYPTYNPNNINSALRYIPLDPTQAEIANREDYIDVHLFVENEDGSMRKATTEERVDPTIRKRIAQNTYGSEVFVDKTIKYAYEP
jgi:cell division protein FtsI/penicillin-binding protein 2